jgi:hypothetical protein
VPKAASAQQWELQGSSFARGKKSLEPLRKKGVSSVLLKLDDVGSHNFRRIRERCGSSIEFQPLSYIWLFTRFPASGRPFYQETLSKFCHSQTLFKIKAAHPFVTTATNKGMLHVGATGSELRKLCQALTVAFKDVRTPETIKPLAPPVLQLKFSISSGLSDKEVDNKLQVAKENFEHGPRTVTAVGLSLRFMPAYPRGADRKDKIWEQEDFPFLGKTKSEWRLKTAQS